MIEKLFRTAEGGADIKKVCWIGGLLLAVAFLGASLIDAPSDAKRESAAPTGEAESAAPATLLDDAELLGTSESTEADVAALLPEKATEPPKKLAVPRAPRGVSTSRLFTGVLLVGLLIVVAVVVARVFLKRTRFGPQGEKVMRVLDAIPLGPKRQVYLIEVHGRRLVLGAAADNISLLSEFAEDEIAERLDKLAIGAPRDGLADARPTREAPSRFAAAVEVEA